MPYISVADCDAAVARFEELGGRAIMEAVDIEVGRFCVVSDPQGAFLTLTKILNPE